MDLRLCVALAILETLLINAVETSVGVSIGYYKPTATFWILFLGQIIAIKFYRIFLYHRYFSPLRHLPTPKGNHPFFGQALNLIRADSPTALYVQWMRQYPNAPLIRFLTFGNNEILLVNSPNAHKDIMQTKCYSFRKPDRWSRMMRDVTGIGLATLEGEEHKAHRKMLSSTFSPNSIRRLQPVFLDKAREVCEFLNRAIAFSGYEAVGTIDCTDTFSKTTLDIMGVTTLGVDLSHLTSTNSGQSSQAVEEMAKSAYTFHDAYNTIFGPDTIGKLLMFGNMFLPTRWLPLEANQKFKFATTWLHETLLQLVRQRFCNVKSTVVEGKHAAKDSRDILSFIVEESMPGGVAAGITENLVKGHLLQFLGAGHDTSANSISWCLYTLATRQDVQARLRDEIRQLTNQTLSPGFSDLDTLHYLNNFVREVLRVYPPASIIYRQANENLMIDGVYVPKNTSFEIVAAMTSMNPCIWGKNAESFDPSRWDHLSDVQASPYAFATFSNGPRICIGRQFALYEIKSILVEIVRNFDILGDVAPFTIENPSLTLRPHGMKIRFRKTV